MADQKNKKYWQRIAEIYNQNVGEKGDIRHEIIINPIVFDFLCHDRIRQDTKNIN